jgi:hypothetical protein
MRHQRIDTPAYLVWVEQRPSNSGAGKRAYVQAIKTAAAAEIAEPIRTADVEVEVVYSTKARAAERMDADNVNKATLDALKGIAYADDAQVRSVTASLFDRNASHLVGGRVEHMGRLFYSPFPHVVLIMIYSDSRLRELGGEAEVRRQRREAWDRDFESGQAAVRAPSRLTRG